ncbi:hypothetical protein ES704_02764 [subsurface metagenome]|jgi:hypothetical protein
MRRFLKLSWHGIPIGIIASALVGTAVVAAGVYFAVTQTITQEIITEPEPEPEPEYGTITVDTAALPQVYAGKSFTKTIVGGVQVDLGPDGAGKGLKLECTASELYDSFDVNIFLTSAPNGSEVGPYGYGVSGGGIVIIGLDLPGLYIFDQEISGRAGSATGTATSTITFTLVDHWSP